MTEREQISQRIDGELPAFVHYLDTSEHPEHMTNARTGAAAWQSLEVLECLQSISPEERLRELLSQCLVITSAIAGQQRCWRGSAAEVERLLTADETTRNSARSLLSWPSACGSYLGRLQVSGRCDIGSSVVRGITRWTIRSLEPVPVSQSRLPLGGGVVD